MAFNSLSGTVVVHPGSHLDASGSAVTATSLYTSGSKGTVYEEAGIKTYTCTDSKQWVSCSGSLITSSLATITLVCVDPPNTNLILTSEDVHSISPSGSINEGPAGATRQHPAFMQLSGNADNSFVDHSYSGSFMSASCGTRTTNACTTILTTTVGGVVESTTSPSGSFLSGSGGTSTSVGGLWTLTSTGLAYVTAPSGSHSSGSEGTTTNTGGVTTHTSTDSESTTSTSGSFTSGSEGTSTSSGGVTIHTSTDSESTTSTSGSFTSGSEGTSTSSGGSTTHTSTDSESTTSTSGSFTSGSEGTSTSSGGSTTHTSTDSESTTSSSGSFTSGSGGATTTTSCSGSYTSGSGGTSESSGGSTTHSGTLGYSTFSTSGSYLIGTAGVVATSPGVISSSATSTLYGLTTYDVSATALSATSLSASSTLNIGGIAQFANSKATINNTGDYSGGALSASSTLNVVGVSNFGPGNLASISAAGVLSGSAPATLASLVTYGIVGSSIEGSSISSSNTLVAVGNSSFGAETGPGAYASISSAGDIRGTSLSSSNTLQAAGTITAGNGKFTVSNEAIVAATSLSASNTLGGLDLVLDAGGTGKIGVTGDLDLLTLTANKVAVAGEIDATTLRGAGPLLQGITGSGAATIPINHALDGGSLARGANYFTASTNPVTVRVPSASYGDQVIVKASSGVTFTNHIKITGTIAIWGEGGAIDGEPEVKITSPYGSVTLVYVKDSDWRIL